jgi:hypothetical protein
MERRFKIGDRVYHHPEGYGMVMRYQDGRVIVDPDDDFYMEKWLCDEDSLEPAAQKSCYYYEEVTRNGRQWFRMTPKGEWMPKRDTDNPARTGDGTTMLPTVEQKYDRDRFEAAKAAMQEILSWDGMTDPVVVAKQAVSFADALIAELEKPKP